MIRKVMLAAFLLWGLSQGAGAGILDEFDDPVLKPWWRIVNEDSTHWSLRVRPGFLRIVTQFDYGSGTPSNLFFHTEAIPGDFEVSAKLICRPDTFGQYSAIYADFDSLRQGTPYAVLGYGNTPYTGMGILGLLNGSPFMASYSDTLVYLRISAVRDTVTADFSGDNLSWAILFQEPDSLFRGHQLSGFLAANFADLGADTGTPPMNADYDWFHLKSLTGVEETPQPSYVQTMAWSVRPNPFVSFATVPGQEGKRFLLFDVQGRRVGEYDGRRIGKGLPCGVYFLVLKEGAGRPHRIVKLR